MDIFRIRQALVQLAAAMGDQDAAVFRVMQRLTAVVEDRCDTDQHCPDCAVGCIYERSCGGLAADPGLPGGTALRELAE